MNIPVVVVDDQEEDRYLAKRHISRSDGFDVPVEVDSGDHFLEQYFNESGAETPADTVDSGKVANIEAKYGKGGSGLNRRKASDRALLVLMDINMPGLNGFETIEEAQRRQARGKGPERIMYLIYTSSENSQDKARARELNIVKGYLAKPIDGEAVGYIRDLYYEQASSL